MWLNCNGLNDVHTLTKASMLLCLTRPLVPTVVFESNGLRGTEVHTTSADAPKQVCYQLIECLVFLMIAGEKSCTVVLLSKALTCHHLCQDDLLRIYPLLEHLISMINGRKAIYAFFFKHN